MDTASVLTINSADDERNPPETGLLVEALTHVKNRQLLLIQQAPKHAAVAPPR